ncbi:MAG TPA: hypothetical protein VF043_26485 [Ktedonobacteraceae bacterium]
MVSTRLKIGFVGVLSCLSLLLGLYSFTGTAFAHSQRERPEIKVRPHVVEPEHGCVTVTISGEDFRPTTGPDNRNIAEFTAFDDDGRFYSVIPDFTFTDARGEFSRSVAVCGRFRHFHEDEFFIRAHDLQANLNSNTVRVNLDL